MDYLSFLNEMQNLPSELKIEFDDLPQYDVAAFDIGIYFLLDRFEIVYIGKSINLIQRVGSHIRENVKKFDSYKIIKCDAEFLDVFEGILIILIRPKYNKKFDINIFDKVPFKRIKSLHSFADIEGLTLEELIANKDIHSDPEQTAARGR